MTLEEFKEVAHQDTCNAMRTRLMRIFYRELPECDCVYCDNTSNAIEITFIEAKIVASEVVERALAQFSYFGIEEEHVEYEARDSTIPPALRLIMKIDFTEMLKNNGDTFLRIMENAAVEDRYECLLTEIYRELGDTIAECLRSILRKYRPGDAKAGATVGSLCWGLLPIHVFYPVIDDIPMARAEITSAVSAMAALIDSYLYARPGKTTQTHYRMDVGLQYDEKCEWCTVQIPHESDVPFLSGSMEEEYGKLNKVLTDIRNCSKWPVLQQQH